MVTLEREAQRARGARPAAVGHVAVAILCVSVISGALPVRLVSTTPVRIVVTPTASMNDEPLALQVTGLRAGQRAIVAVASTDARGLDWVSHATFVANRHGAIDPSRVAPRAGSYSGVQPMGMIDWMSAPSSRTSVYFYSWGRPPSAFRFTVTVARHAVATTTVQRFLVPSTMALDVQDVSVDDAGFVGRYIAPQRPGSLHAAILLFGGSEGGMNGGLLAFTLAAHGYPTLNLAYFDAPGLPATLANIPLEYFANALTWLGAQSGVDADHLWVMGASRGGEAALLLGARYPDLIYGVAALTPSNVVNCANPPACTMPSWTLGGQPVPFTHQFGEPNPTDTPDAVIPVERIRGPVLTLCGGADPLVASCAAVRAIATRLQGAANGQPTLPLAYPDAGHEVNTLIPYQPSGPSERDGRTPTADMRAREAAWPLVLDFLANPQ
jgi:dienelactone hydrolase